MAVLRLGKKHSSELLESWLLLGSISLDTVTYRQFLLQKKIWYSSSRRMLPHGRTKHSPLDTSGVPLTMEGSRMINEETRRKLKKLSLEEMINAFDLQDKYPSYLPAL